MVSVKFTDAELPSLDGLLRQIDLEDQRDQIRVSRKQCVGAFSAVLSSFQQKVHASPAANVATPQDAKNAKNVLPGKKVRSDVVAESVMPPAMAELPNLEHGDLSHEDAELPGAAAERRAVLVAWGSRGDVQPVVALAMCLQELGFRVKMLVNGDERAGFVRSFALDVEAYPEIVRFDVQAEMNGERHSNMGHIDSCPQYLAIWQKVKAFQPELLLYPDYCNLEAWLIEERLQICTMMFSFHRDGRNVLDWSRDYINDVRARKRSLEERLQTKVFSSLTEQKIRSMIGGCRPMLYAASAQVAKWEAAWQEPTESAGLHLTGYWVVDESLQKDAKASCSAFFGGKQSKELDAFLSTHKHVVYIGWGSMHVKSGEFMAQLAVRALELARRDGIVLGSYCDLGRDMLTGAPDEVFLKAYADKHVLWLQWAPHEWLMPRCDVVVHHGGCGTTAASLRAGRPTIITPIGFDQFYWAEMVKRKGVGTCTQQLASTSAQSLADAIRSCDRGEVRHRAAELGKSLRREDGAREAARVIARYWETEVRSGRWKKSALGLSPGELAQDLTEAPMLPSSCADLARGRPVTASSSKSPEKAPANVVDGQSWTRWTSQYSDSQWLMVDLGEVQKVSSVNVHWEAAYAEDYLIEGSEDGTLWAELAHERGHAGWANSRLVSSTKARWIRLNLLKRATRFGFSVWALEVFA